MSQELPHNLPDFASAEEAEVYDRWFREKVQAALADASPAAPHDQVMKAMRELIEAKVRANASGPLAR